MATYKIAGILINFEYALSDYFKDNLEKYEVNSSDTSKYSIKSFVSGDFSLPKEPITLIYKTRHLYESDQESVLVVYDEAFTYIKQKQTKRKDLSEIIIQLNPNYNERLAEMEYIATGMAFFDIAIQERRLPLHAAAIVYNDETILISAPSRTGKSTHAALWIESLDSVTILNDDKPLIWDHQGQFFVSGTPWAGKTIQNENLNFSLKTIVFLSQGKCNHIVEFNNKDKLMKLLQNTYRPGNISAIDISTALMNQLIEKIPMIGFEATMDQSAFKTLYHYLYQEEVRENKS
jgi:hypothetical protein